jgi:hypothetical protein
LLSTLLTPVRTGCGVTLTYARVIGTQDGVIERGVELVDRAVEALESIVRIGLAARQCRAASQCR